MSLLEAEAWSWSLLRAIKRIITLDLQLVIFEVDCKLVDDVVGTNASAKASVSYADR
jgi:hypothetical protein